ncbi:hypothetical protein D3C72_1242200 [compost metagenome]
MPHFSAASSCASHASRLRLRCASLVIVRGVADFIISLCASTLGTFTGNSGTGLVT